MSLNKSLESWQRAWLRKQAHSLQPVVHIGVSGLSPAVEKAFKEALASHELVKVKFIQAKEKKDMSAYLAQQFDAVLVDVIGNTAIFWKPSADPEQRKYTIPSRRSVGRKGSDDYDFEA